MRSLFGGRRGNDEPEADNALASIKAGRSDGVQIREDPPTLRITSDRRKGVLEVVRKRDGLVHVVWKDRTSGAELVDTIALPNTVSLEMIDTGRAGDRVFKLKTDGGLRRFFWMQEADASRDVQRLRSFVQTVNSPPAPAPAAGLGGAGGAGGLSALQQLLSQRRGGSSSTPASGGNGRSGGSGGDSGSREAMLRALQEMDVGSLMGPTDGNDTQGGGMRGADRVDADDLELQRALEMSMREAEGDNDDAPQSSAAPMDIVEEDDDDDEDGFVAEEEEEEEQGDEAQEDNSNDPRRALEAALEAALESVGSNQSTPLPYVWDASKILEAAEGDEDAMRRLRERLPESLREDAGAVADAARSPQVAQALAALSRALNNENMEGVFANFGLDPRDGAEAMAHGDGVRAFLDALQARIRRERESRE